MEKCKPPRPEDRIYSVTVRFCHPSAAAAETEVFSSSILFTLCRLLPEPEGRWVPAEEVCAGAGLRPLHSVMFPVRRPCWFLFRRSKRVGAGWM